MELQYNRFKDAPWFPGTEKIYAIVGGAGGISSWLTLFLARAGFNPMVFDFDMLEEHNLGGQLFPKSGIMKPKVEVLQQVVLDFADTHISVFQQRYDSSSMAHNIMFSGFDNMKARQDMFSQWLNYSENVFQGNKNESIFIDGRLLAEQMQIFCVRAEDKESVEKYKSEFLFGDEEVPDAACTFKQTSHAAAMIAGFMTSFFTNHMANVREGNTARQVPFQTEYFIPLNMLT